MTCTGALGEAPGGARAHFPKVPRYIEAPSQAATAKPGSTLASSGSAHVSHGSMASHRPTGGDFAVPAYSISSLRPGLTTFDALNPSATYTPVNTSDDWIYSATFVGNDFSKLWVIINDSWLYEPGTYGTLDTATASSPSSAC